MAGNRGDEELREGLSAHDYELADIDHLVLTHAHADHVGQVRTLVETGNPTVYAPAAIRAQFERDVDVVRNAARTNLKEAGVPSSLLDPALDHFLDATRTVRDSLPLDAVDVWIEPGEPVPVGEYAFEPIATPGHHVTHTCHAVDLLDERVRFSGDVAIEYVRSATIHVGLDDGVSAFRDTLDRLTSYSFDRVFPGHGPVHGEFADAIEQSITDLEERIETCRAALDDEGRTPVDVARDQGESFGDVARLLPEIVGTLATLERDGRARSRLDDGVRYYEPA